jgi:hypothetical protein
MGQLMLALLIAWLVLLLAVVPLVSWIARRVSALRTPDLNRFEAFCAGFITVGLPATIIGAAAQVSW